MNERQQKNLIPSECGRILALLVALLIFPSLMHAEIKISPADGPNFKDFGSAVAISGDTIIIGAPRESTLGNPPPGTAYIFVWDGVSWTQQAMLTPEVGAFNPELFGLSVSISGDYAIVGSPKDEDRGWRSGAAYIFNRSAGNWTQQAKLVASDGSTEDLFGYSVAIFGDFAIVGARDNNDYGEEAGAAYIFERNGNTWIENTRLVPAELKAYDGLGGSVAISDKFAAVATYGLGDNAANAGHVYIYKRNHDEWIRHAMLTPDNGGRPGGISYGGISIFGDYVIVGAAYSHGANGRLGIAYIFKRHGDTWKQSATLVTDQLEQDFDGFGYSVGISHGYAVVGAFYGYSDVAFSGVAHIFRRSGSLWQRLTKLSASDAQADDLFGSAAAISESWAIVGAYLKGPDQFAYIYDDFFEEDSIQEIIVRSSPVTIKNSAGSTEVEIEITGSKPISWSAVSNDSWLTIASGAQETDCSTITLSYPAYQHGSVGGEKLGLGSITISAAGVANSPLTFEVRRDINDTSGVSSFNSSDTYGCFINTIMN